MSTSVRRELPKIEVFGEPWIRSVLGSSASKPKGIFIIWVVFGLLPMCSYLVTTQIDGSLRIEDGIGLLDDVPLFV